MNVLVAGGSGFVGSELCRALAERGHSVTALSRSIDPDRFGDEVRTVRGDVTEYETIESAFEGQNVAVNLVALSPLFEPDGGAERHERVHLDGTRNVVDAASVHGASKLLQLSALGADPDGPTAYIRAKGRAEGVVRNAALDHVIVRPSVVFGDGGEFLSFTKVLTTPYVTGLPGGGRTRFQPIWIGDLVSLLVAAVEGDSHRNAAYEFGGPEVLTLADVTRAVYRSEGTPVVVLPVPMALARIGLTVAGYVPAIPMGVDQYRSLRFDNTVADNDVAAFGRDPDDLRTLSAYLEGTTDEPERELPGREMPSTTR